MESFAVGFAAVRAVLQISFLAAAAVLTVVCVVDWAVRTRRINPFHPVARFFRSSVDPLIAPVERRVVRAGGLPSNAPFWALAAVVLAGIIVLTLLDFVAGQIVGAAYAVRAGPRGIFVLLVSTLFSVLQIALIVRVISSWVNVSPYSKWVRWAFVLTDWFMLPLSRIVPRLGMIDITPIVAYILLRLLAGLFLRMA